MEQPILIERSSKGMQIQIIAVTVAAILSAIIATLLLAQILHVCHKTAYMPSY